MTAWTRAKRKGYERQDRDELALPFYPAKERMKSASYMCAMWVRLLLSLAHGLGPHATQSLPKGVER